MLAGDRTLRNEEEPFVCVGSVKSLGVVNGFGCFKGDLEGGGFGLFF
jgi:hypothetical protein